METSERADLINIAGCDAEIEHFIKGLIDGRGFVGASLTIADDDRIVLHTQDGWCDREAERPIAADTIVRIYSMTKPVIATALMSLFDERRFELDDPVADYLPTLATPRILVSDRLIEPDRPIRIRDLLTHTSGMTHELQPTPVAALYRDAGIHADATRTLAEVVETLAELPLAYHPGERWHYGAGFEVCAGLIEVLADQPLGDFLHDRLFDPLGMPDTAFGVPDDRRDRLAAMYGGPDLLARGQSLQAVVDAWTSGDNPRRDVNATNPTDMKTFARGGFGLFSTAMDYTRFARMLLRGGELDGTRIITPDTARLMHHNHLPDELLPFVPGTAPATGWGFGLGSMVLIDVDAAGGIGSPGQHGWGGAASTTFWVDPYQRRTVLFMAQSMMRMDTWEADLADVVNRTSR